MSKLYPGLSEKGSEAARQLRPVILLYLEIVGENDLPTTITDLLADIQHYCDAHGINFAEQLRLSYTHYEAEKEQG